MHVYIGAQFHYLTTSASSVTKHINEINSYIQSLQNTNLYSWSIALHWSEPYTGSDRWTMVLFHHGTETVHYNKVLSMS